MKKIIFLFSYFFTILVRAQEDTFLFYKESVADIYYRFLDNSTSFLYDKSNYEYIKKHNKLRLYFNTSINDEGRIKSSPSIRANIKLPKLSKNLFLSIDKESKITGNPNEQNTPVNKEEKSSRVGLKYYFKRDIDSAIFAKLGGRPTLSGNKIYLQFGTEKLKKIDFHYIFLYFYEYYYIRNKILKTQFGINYKKRLSNNLIFLQNNNINIEKKEPIFFDNSFVLEQYINKKTAFSYWISLFSQKENQNIKLNNISYNYKYHYMIKKWIFIDVIPSYVTTFRDKKETNKYLYINFGFIF